MAAVGGAAASRNRLSAEVSPLLDKIEILKMFPVGCTYRFSKFSLFQIRMVVIVVVYQLG
jgi:hypothetical protein